MLIIQMVSRIFTWWGLLICLAFRKRLVGIVTPCFGYDQSNGHLHKDSCEVGYRDGTNLYYTGSTADEINDVRAAMLQRLLKGCFVVL